MESFEPTHQHREFAAKVGACTAVSHPTPALRLPAINRAAGHGRGRVIEQGYQKAQPRLDHKSLARFVRSMHARHLLADSELAQGLSVHAGAGLYHLAHIAAGRLGERTKLAQQIDFAALHNRLKGSQLDPAGVATLAHAGNRLVLFDTVTLSETLRGMDVPTAQFGPWFWDRLLESSTTEAERTLYDDAIITSELHQHEEGVFVTLHSYEPMVNYITVPGDGTPESVLVRDTLMALIDSLIYATEGMTPSECLGYICSAQEEAADLRGVMGGPFDGPALLAYLEDATGIERDDDEDALADAVMEQAEDFHSLALIGCLHGWADVMGVLSDPQHWFNQTTDRVMPHQTVRNQRDRQENIKALHDHAAAMVTSLRQQHGTDYPETLAAAEQILSIVAIRAQRAIAARSPWDDEANCDGNPLGSAIRAWLTVRGGKADATILNELFGCHLPDMENSAFNCGVEYVDAIHVSRDAEQDGSEALAQLLGDIGACFASLSQLAGATDKEVKAGEV